MNTTDFIAAKEAFKLEAILLRAAHRQCDYVQLQNCMRLLRKNGKVTIWRNMTAIRNLYARYGSRGFAMCNGLIRGRVSESDIYLRIC